MIVKCKYNRKIGCLIVSCSSQSQGLRVWELNYSIGSTWRLHHTIESSVGVILIAQKCKQQNHPEGVYTIYLINYQRELMSLDEEIPS